MRSGADHLPMPRQLHARTATAAIPAAALGLNPVVLPRIWGSGVACGHFGASGEGQDDEDCGKPSLPVHHFPPKHLTRRTPSAINEDPREWSTPIAIQGSNV